MGAAGIAIAVEPVPLVTLVERHGGALDPGIELLFVDRVVPLEPRSAVAAVPAHEPRSALSPLLSRRHLAAALRSHAVLLVAAELAPLVPPDRRWVHPHAAWALAGLLSAAERALPPWTAAHAHVDPDARVAADVAVGPGALIMAGASIGEGSVVEPHAVIYPGVRIGARVVVGAGAIVGRPGFGWAQGPDGAQRRMPQLGGVVVEDDVEIGPLATVDAGTLGPTVLGRGVKLDAHVHVAHNATLGAGTLVAAQSGFAGSVQVGEGVRIGGQAGFADHVRVGDGARVAAQSGVIGDVPRRGVVAGYPAVARVRWLRGVARMLKLGGRSGEERE